MILLYILLAVAAAFIVAYFVDNHRASSAPQQEISRGKNYHLSYFFKPQMPVKWFDFSGLINTFRRVSLSGDILSIIDKREVQTAMGKDSGRELIDNVANQSVDEFWFDYIADTGDGFDPTTTVFYHLTRPEYCFPNLTKDENQDKSIDLKRGDALVIGGDLVYPAGSEDNYRDRFKGPLRFVSPDNSDKNPIIVATPGNHDWYDGLTAFFRLMCQKCRIGNYKTVQNRSYFAYKLRENVHLFGVDNQLLGDIDIPQLDFFVKYVQEISSQNKKNHAILVVAEPYWYNYSFKDRAKRRQRMDSLEFIVRSLCQTAKNHKNSSELIFDVVLTGDIHHYSHYELSSKDDNPEGFIRHFITSGGGGAFGHLTDFLPEKIEVPQLRHTGNSALEYDLKKVFPSREKSKKAVSGLPFFFIINYKYTALILLISFVITYIWNYNDDPLLKGLMLLLFPLMLYFTVKKVANPEPSDRERNLNRFLHSSLFCVALAVQIAVLIVLPKFGLKILADVAISLKIQLLKNYIILPETAEYFIFQWVFSGIMLSWVFGMYLFFSYRFFKLHITEVSSAKINTGDKNFLKFKITDGEILIYVIGIKKSYPWTKLLKSHKARDIQTKMETEDPKDFVKTYFSAHADENTGIIEIIRIPI
jgi:hypothetical protein